MKLIRMIGRDIRDASKSVFRNISLSMASLSCIIITLILVGLSVILSYNIDNFTKLIQKDFTIVVFLDKDITAEETTAVKNAIKNNANISSSVFESKTAIANAMMATSDVYKNIMEQWSATDNPLKDTITVKVRNIEKITMTAKELEKLSNVSTVKYGEGIVENFLSIFKTIQKGLIAVVILFVIVTAFLITNTIKLTIFSRRREIEIMRLVGASNFNIELPFIVEGLILGLLGAVIPVILAIYGYSSLFNNFDGQIISPFVKLVNPTPFIYLVAAMLIILGILVGMFGSFRAVRKYLKI